MQNMITSTTNLVPGLRDEGERWKVRIENFNEETASTVGDILLALAFVSFAGLLTRQFRDRFIEDIWRPFLVERSIKITKNPIDFISHSALVAQWNNQ
jgi:hypothetical protein